MNTIIKLSTGELLPVQGMAVHIAGDGYTTVESIPSTLSEADFEKALLNPAKYKIMINEDGTQQLIEQGV